MLGEHNQSWLYIGLNIDTPKICRTSCGCVINIYIAVINIMILYNLDKSFKPFTP